MARLYVHKVEKDNKAVGKICTECGVYFTFASGYPVVCKHCKTWRKTKGFKPLPVSKFKELTIQNYKLKRNTKKY